MSHVKMLACFVFALCAGAAPLSPIPNPADLLSGHGDIYPDPTLQDAGLSITTSASSAASITAWQHAPGQDVNAEYGVYIAMQDVDDPQPFRGDTGATDPGPRNMQYEKLNSDLYAPPPTDAGDYPNAVWPLALSHNRHGIDNSGWARQQNTDQLPVSTAMAGVDMRLNPYAYRELHWHTANEWSFIMRGSVRVAAVNEDGESFIDDLQAGDVWFFPRGVPHSLQALDDGVEFLLVFDSGDFSEDGTFLASELIQRLPREVVSKNLGVDQSALKNLPTGQKYIFPGTSLQNVSLQDQNITGPAGFLSNGSYSFHWSKQEPYSVAGGSVKILDPKTFPTANFFSVALVTISPGAMREIHWHPSSDEWSFYLQGTARLTAYEAPQTSRTVDFHAGDVGYVPTNQAHYIENTGTEDVILLEVLQADHFSDISMNQWFALTPHQIVADTVNIDKSIIDGLNTTKSILIQGNTDLSDPNGELNSTSATTTR